jgi:hypothetical protein
MILIFGNNDQTVLAAPINNSVTTLNVFPGGGTSFPHPVAGEYFVMTLTDAATGSINEIMWVTNVTGDTFTVQRGKEGTAASSWLAGDFVSCFPTAGTQETFIQPDQAQTGKYNFSVATGTPNALTAAISSNLTTLPDGLSIVLKSSAQNTTSATLNLVLGSTITGVFPIVKLGNKTLVNGDIPAAGFPIILNWSSTFAAWVMQNPATSSEIGIISESRNLTMRILTAGFSGTATADQIILETISQNQSLKLINYNKTINLSTVGAGGMDVGSSPINGFVAIYAIYNPTTNQTDILATDTTSILATNSYSGANLPAGYIYSALLAVWPTNASRQFKIGLLTGRTLNIVSTLVLSTTTFPRVASALSVSTAVPINAVSVSGNLQFSATSGTGSIRYQIWDAQGVVTGERSASWYSVGGASILTDSFQDVFTANSQGINLATDNFGGSVSAATTQVTITGYTI